MKETPLSNVERAFVLAAANEGKRADGRSLFEHRRCKVTFGETFGQAEVQVGDTRVLAQVACEVAEPSPDRPTEGIMRYNVELSPMAAPSFEAGRPSPLAVELGRVLERVLRDSRTVDLESLCIVAGQQVWSLRLDAHVLDYDGNAIDAISLAALAALSHFRRPYVTVNGEDVKIFALDEHEPVALTVHHFPVCVTMTFLNEGQRILVDATRKEELVGDGRLTVALNNHREVCLLHKSGALALTPDQIASKQTAALLDVLNEALAADEQRRKAAVWSRADLPGKTGANKKITDSTLATQAIPQPERADFPVIDEPAGQAGAQIVHEGQGTATLFEGNVNGWDSDGEDTGLQIDLSAFRTSQDEPSKRQRLLAKENTSGGGGQSKKPAAIRAAGAAPPAAAAGAAPQTLMDAIKPAAKTKKNKGKKRADGDA